LIEFLVQLFTVLIKLLLHMQLTMGDDKSK